MTSQSLRVADRRVDEQGYTSFGAEPLLDDGAAVYGTVTRDISRTAATALDPCFPRSC